MIRAILLRRALPLALLLALSIAPSAAAAISNVQVQQVQVTEDDQFQGVVATFEDNQNSDPALFTATIDWGDGSASQGTVSCRSCQVGAPSQFEVRASHTWADPGDYVLRVVIDNQQQDSAAGQGSAHVAAR